MPRRLKHCFQCRMKFVASGLDLSCAACRTNDAGRKESTPQIQQGSNPSSKENAWNHHDPIEIDSFSFGGTEKRHQVHDSASMEEDENDAASEAGDDVFCTQIVETIDSDSDEDEEEDECIALTELVTKKCMSLEVQPVCFHSSSETGVDIDTQTTQPLLPDSKETADSTMDSADIDVQDDDRKLPSSPQQILLQGSTVEDTNQDLRICSICGETLLHIKTWKGRVNHFKRCSKEHGVSVNDARERIQEEVAFESTEDCTVVDHSVEKPSVMAPAAKAPSSVMDLLMAGAKKAVQTARWKQKEKHVTTSTVAATASSGEAGQKRSFRQRNYNIPPDPAKIRPCPAFKRITGTDFVVDGFYYAKPTLTQNYFLTHFHSDHYGGITKHWQAGTIYCSEATANLVNSQLGVDRKFLYILPMNKPTNLKTGRGSTVTVTLLDANHCPGAVMMLFQVSSRFILHVGDFRFCREVMLAPPQSPLFGFHEGRLILDELFLDTTYCDPKHDLPSQDDAIQAAVEFAEKKVKEARSLKQRILLLFGAYTIGKERIYLAVASRLKMKVYVDRRRFRILSQLGWPKEQMDLLTTKPDESILWVVPLGHVGMKKLPSYTSVQIGKTFSKSFDHVFGFRPTGWSMTRKVVVYKDGSRSSLIKATTRGKVTSCGIPYSEHSSFPELVDCIKALKPRKIIPTVSVSKSKQQVDLLLSHVAKGTY